MSRDGTGVKAMVYVMMKVLCRTTNNAKLSTAGP